MALMIPATLPEETESAAEHALYRLLRDTLDAKYTVFHSFTTVTPNLDGVLLDGEIDFLIFSPTDGFLVLEAKSGAVVYEGSERRWRLNGKPIRDPFQQARANKYKLRDFLRIRLGKTLPYSFTHAVCFPHTFAEPSALPPDVDRTQLLTGRDLDHLATKVQQVFAASGPAQRRLSDKEVEQLRHVLMPYCEYGVQLSDRIELAERRLFSLTDEQCRMLDFIRVHRTALIRGCAGSGKTVMAVKKARELATDGHRVLLLAYNKLIGRQLTAAVTDLPNVTAGTYHDYCTARLEEAGCLPESGPDDDYFNRAVPQAFYELVSSSEDRYDALIVDEGQDFRTDYWLSIDCLLRDGGYCYIFYDPDQNVFGSEMAFPLDGPEFMLSDNCRNTKTICEYVARYASETMRPMVRAPEGEEVQEFVNPSPRGRRARLGAILDELVCRQGLLPERIIILGGHSIANTCIPTDGTVGRFKVVEGGAAGRHTIRYHTYMKFKGCEADAAILLDVDPNDVRWSDRAIYTTASRAKHLLYVVRAA